MTLRRTLLALALTLPAWSQSKDSGPAPLQIVTRTAAVDASGFAGKNNSTIGLFLDIHNVSGKNVAGYVLDVKFVDPSTNTILRGAGHERMAARETGDPMRPGGCDCSNPKPIMLRKTPAGAVSEPKITLDLVVFEDGTSWGAGELVSSQQLLKQSGAAAPAKL